MKRISKAISSVLACCILFAGGPGLAAQIDQPAADVPMQAANPTEAQVEQLVAPIALYPDNLVAQILAAATYPDQVVEADRWMQAHAELK